VSRLTKQIRLVLISSSLALGGCGRNPQTGLDCQQRPPGDGKQTPSVCGPVDGQSGTHGTTYHNYGYGHHFWSWGGSSVGHNGTSSWSGGHAGVGSARGGFGSSGHGVAS
jgi:hypothetical protein